jgi:hypothetical protein
MSENGPRLQEAIPQSAQSAVATPSRRGLYWPYAVFGLICAGWTGFWFFSAHMAGKIADGFITRESERGRIWVCPERSVGGYPFRIEISCRKPQLILKGTTGLEKEGSLAGLSLNARLLSPGHFIAVLAPPFIARQGGAGEMEISWKSARASLRAGTQSITEASVEFVEPNISAGAGDKQDIKAIAKMIELHMRRTPGEVAGTDLVARVDDLTFAPLDRLTGTPEPIRVEIQVTAPGLIPEPKARFQDILEQWRLTQHKARVVVLKAVKGQADIDLSGTMALDGEHRLEGNLQGRAKGIEALTGRFTRRNGIDIGGLLGKIGGGQGLPVALTLQNGVMRFGPFPLTELQPLY